MRLATYEPGVGHRVPPEATGNTRHTAPGVESLRGRQFGNLWDRHGRSVYALAYTLLGGDDEAATRAVTLGMTDLARSSDSVSTKDARRSMARHVYWRSQEIADKTRRTTDLPPAMVWLSQLAQLQRACLALCVFGGHTHREAAGVLDVPPMMAAELLTAGLRELGRLATGGLSTGA